MKRCKGGALILSYQKLIEKLKDKGVKFEIVDENQAIHFLEEHNYYVKLSSYRFNFAKNKSGKYVGLDFFHLKELSTIDMHLKFFILKACLNIEHSLKVNLLKEFLNENINDFKIIQSYDHEFPKTLKNITSAQSTSYTKNLLSKYKPPHYPVWVFLEVISFGDLVNFYKFCQERYAIGSFPVAYLYKVKNIRNAAAHSNCIIHCLLDKSNYYNQGLLKEIKRLCPHIKEGSIKNKLQNKSVEEFIALYITLNHIVKSDEIKKARIAEVIELLENRAVRNANYFKAANILKQNYDFILQILYSINT